MLAGPAQEHSRTRSGERPAKGSAAGARRLEGAANPGDLAFKLALNVPRSAGSPLDGKHRASMEAFFAHDLRNVRVHADAAAAASAGALWANAFTVGNHVVFGEGRYEPGSSAGRRLLAHELAHVVQNDRGGPGGAGGLEREAQAAERGEPPATANRVGAPTPAVQLQGDDTAIRARLQEIQARLTALRAQQAQLDDAFTGSTMQERQRAAEAQARARLQADVRSDAAARGLWGGSFTASRVRRAVSATVSGSSVTLIANLRIAYLALPDADARQQAEIDIPRIEAAIRDVWQVNITSGDYAGVQLRLVPRITYVPNTAPPPTDAFLIQVRGPDTGPSSGEPVTGIISLAPVHLQGARVVVVAHELAHLFGFVDAYLTMTTRSRSGAAQTTASVARADPANRPDLLGMIDPVILARWRASGAITAQDVARQTGPVHVWEEDASVVLGTLGVAPPARPRPTPDSEDFDPQVELERVRREGEARLAAARARRERAENSIRWVQITEQIMVLEQEETRLRARLGSSP